MTVDEIFERLVSSFDYPDVGARLVAEKLLVMQPATLEAFAKWWSTGAFPELVVEGYSVTRLMSEHGMNPIAALLTLDWLLREPEAALRSLDKGHDEVRMPTHNTPDGNPAGSGVPSTPFRAASDEDPVAPDVEVSSTASSFVLNPPNPPQDRAGGQELSVASSPNRIAAEASPESGGAVASDRANESGLSVGDEHQSDSARVGGSVTMICDDGSEIECEDEPFDQSGQGVAYRSLSRKYICLLLRDWAEDHPAHVDQSILEYAGLVGDGESGFILPLKRIVLPQPGLAFRAMRKQGVYLGDHVPLGSFMAPTCQGSAVSWDSRISVCRHLARAIGMLHQISLCLSDLSPDNVLVRVMPGASVLVARDILFLPSIALSETSGTPWYIAPEEISDDGSVSQLSTRGNLHTLAVLIYETLLLHHPLIGPKIHGAATAEEEDLLAQGKRALYIEHPTDHSNRPKDLRFTTDLLTPRMKKLFEQAFVEGLREPSRRPLASQWEDALKRMADRTVQCQNGDCLMKAFVMPEHHQPECPWCGMPYRDPAGRFPLLTLYRPGGRPGGFVPDDWDIVGYGGRSLYEYHKDPSARPPMSGASAEIARLSYRDGEWYLHNLSDLEMRVLTEGGRPLAQNESQMLREGAKVLLGPMGKARALFVRFVNT